MCTICVEAWPHGPVSSRMTSKKRRPPGREAAFSSSMAICAARRKRFALGLPRSGERSEQPKADFRSRQVMPGIAARAVVAHRVAVDGGVGQRLREARRSERRLSRQWAIGSRQAGKAKGKRQKPKVKSGRFRLSPRLSLSRRNNGRRTRQKSKRKSQKVKGALLPPFDLPLPVLATRINLNQRRLS